MVPKYSFSSIKENAYSLDVLLKIKKVLSILCSELKCSECIEKSEVCVIQKSYILQYKLALLTS